MKKEITIAIDLWAECLMRAAPPESTMTKAMIIALIYIMEHPQGFGIKTVNKARSTVSQAHKVVTMQLNEIGIHPDSVQCDANWNDGQTIMMVAMGVRDIEKFEKILN